jgi:SynChlorMet cassette radical SAM/SPASM protein ScmF
MGYWYGEMSSEEVKSTASPRCYSLSILQFLLTDGCNLRCRHCVVDAKFQTEKKQCTALDSALFQHIVRQAKSLGLSSVKLGGGEPLLHPRIGEVLEIIRREEIDLTIATNGTLCTPALVSDLVRCRLRHIDVSLDGADAETHERMRGVADCFKDAVQGIRNLVAAGIRPHIVMSVTRQNAGQMDAVVRLAKSLGALSVQFNLVKPIGRGERMSAAGELLTVRELVRLGTWVENELSRKATLPVCFTQPIAFRPLARMFGQRGIGCGTCGILNVLGVLSDGSYALCAMGEMVRDLIIGHAGENALERIWRQSPLLEEVRGGLPHRFQGICGKCVVRNICQGRCIVQNYEKSRDFWAPYWFCEEADKEGLFPESRKQYRVGRAPHENPQGNMTAKRSAGSLKP